jgi:WD40 repeat protein
MCTLKHDSTPKGLRPYPTLCVGSSAIDQLRLWDIRTRNLIQMISINPSSYQIIRLQDVDANQTPFVATHGECVFQLRESYIGVDLAQRHSPFNLGSSSIAMELCL